MRALKSLSQNSEKYKELQQLGWLTPQFLSLISESELIFLLDLKADSEIQEQAHQILQQIKTQESINTLSNNFSSVPTWALSTKVSNLDDILDNNGICAGQITMVYGKFRSGKSQLSHQLCVSAYEKFQHQLPQKIALFIDTEGTFRPERIRQMTSASSLPIDDILNRILVFQVRNLSEYNLIMDKIEGVIQEYNIKFIAIDSLTKLYRLEMAKEDSVYFRTNGNLIKNLKKLSLWARQYNLPVLITSQVTAALKNIYFFNVLPIMNSTLNIFIKECLLLGEDEQITALQENQGRRYAHLINGQNKPESIRQFKITQNGLEDFYL
ncbi:MAG: ATPase domain-containing protein [Promethearchaeota archaeon]